VSDGDFMCFVGEGEAPVVLRPVRIGISRARSFRLIFAELKQATPCCTVIVIVF